MPTSKYITTTSHKIIIYSPLKIVFHSNSTLCKIIKVSVSQFHSIYIKGRGQRGEIYSYHVLRTNVIQTSAGNQLTQVGFEVD
jgi:hypothetical protein